MKRARLSLGRRIAVVPAACMMAALGTFVLSGPASAARTQVAQNTIIVTFPVLDANIFIKGINTNVETGPGTLTSVVSLTPVGNLIFPVTSTLTLPTPTVSFHAPGAAHVNAVVAVIQNGPSTGTLDLNTGAVTSTSSVTLKVMSLMVNGHTMPAGTNCQSVAPTSVTLNSEADFNPLGGGHLSGTFTIPMFGGHCEAATAFIAHTWPGAGNTIRLNLGQPQLQLGP